MHKSRTRDVAYVIVEVSNERDEMAETLQDLDRLIAPIVGQRAKCGHVDVIGHLMNAPCGKCVRRDYLKGKRGVR